MDIDWRRVIALLLVLVVASVVWVEWLVFEWSASSCNWPSRPCHETSSESECARVLLLADPHLLGPFRGHPFDKIRREWQMTRFFRAINRRLEPHAVFILGDLFDEGQWANIELLESFKERLEELFPVGNKTRLFVLAGNHDLGYHYAIHPSRVDWFEDRLRRPSVSVERVGSAVFVLLTSMAFEGDGCRFCGDASRALDKLSAELRCARSMAEESNSSECRVSDARLLPYSEPIVLQHYPLFRESDSECSDIDDQWWEDVLPPERMRPNWECVNKKESHKLLERLRPRLVVGGHSHRLCRKRWKRPVPALELTLNSFSWRNGARPRVALLSVTNKTFNVSTCRLSDERFVYCTYGVVLICAITLLILVIVQRLRSKSQTHKKD